MGMPQDAVNRLPELPLEKISILASSGMLCFSSRLSEKFWRELLHTEMDEDLLRTANSTVIRPPIPRPFGH